LNLTGVTTISSSAFDGCKFTEILYPLSTS